MDSSPGARPGLPSQLPLFRAVTVTHLWKPKLVHLRNGDINYIHSIQLSVDWMSFYVERVWYSYYHWVAMALNLRVLGSAEKLWKVHVPNLCMRGQSQQIYGRSWESDAQLRWNILSASCFLKAGKATPMVWPSGKHTSFRSSHTWVQIRTLQFLSHVTLSKLSTISESQFSLLWNGDNTIFLAALL